MVLCSLQLPHSPLRTPQPTRRPRRSQVAAMSAAPPTQQQVAAAPPPAAAAAATAPAPAAAPPPAGQQEEERPPGKCHYYMEKVGPQLLACLALLSSARGLQMQQTDQARPPALVIARRSGGTASLTPYPARSIAATTSTLQRWAPGRRWAAAAVQALAWCWPHPCPPHCFNPGPYSDRSSSNTQVCCPRLPTRAGHGPQARAMPLGSQGRPHGAGERA